MGVRMKIIDVIIINSFLFLFGIILGLNLELNKVSDNTQGNIILGILIFMFSFVLYSAYERRKDKQ